MSSFKKLYENLPWPSLEGRIRKAEVAHDLGISAREAGDYVEGIRHFQEVLDLLSGAGPMAAKRALRRYMLVAAAHNQQGVIELDRGHFAEASAALDQAIALRRELLRLFPEERENQVYLGGTLCNRGHACADSDPESAAGFYHESLSMLRQPMDSCECGYWDEERQSWWCSQLECLAGPLRLPWVELAPRYIDNAMAGLRSLQAPGLRD
jgi:tetratricopeptide (TPR) repeat protein